MSEEINILVVSRVVKFYNSLLVLISELCTGKVFFASGIEDAQRILMTHDISAVILNTPLSDGFGLDFAIKTATEKNYPLLLLVSKELFEQVNSKISNSGILTLQKPTSADTLSQSLTLLISTVSKLKKLRTKDNKDNSLIKELALLNRAKMLLISSFSMTETQAHKYIERRAMEERKTKLSIAESILNSYGT